MSACNKTLQVVSRICQILVALWAPAGSSRAPKNSFSATIVASNPCSTSSVGVVPIYVSVAPIANFDAPEIVCVNNQVCLNNTSIGEENFGSGSSCNTSPKIIWDISPSTGFVVSSGNIGDNFESNDPNVWNSGSDNLCLNFTEPGNYIVSLDTGNRCGIDTLTKNICVEDNLTPVFTTSVNGGCKPLSLTVSNMTENLSSCQTASYLWAVTWKFVGL